MKKIMALVLVMIFSLSLTFSFAKNEFKGKGTKDSPYLIETKDDLELLSESVYNGKDYNGKYFLLTNDITLNDTKKFHSWDTNPPENSWQPIGTPRTYFKGKFDGNGKSITGIYISDETKNYAGLFGYAKGGEIKNLNVERAHISARSDVGLVVGFANDVTLRNLTAEGTVYGKANVGGIAGSIKDSDITNAVSKAEVMSIGSSGGIAGYADMSQVKSATSEYDVTGNLTAGGIIGHAVGSDIKNAYSEGEITAESYSGGIVGYMDEFGTMEYVYALGNVISEKAAGGISGLCYGTLKSAYYKGFVSGEYMGALIGINSSLSEDADFEDFGEIENAYFAEDRCENAVGYTVAEEDDHDILGLKASKIDSFFIKKYILNPFSSLGNLIEAPDDVWVFEGKNPALYIEFPELFEKPSVKPEIGLKTGEVITTDIRAYIEGYEIKAVNIAGKMAIALRDLREFGFDVTFDEVKRAVNVSYKGGEITSSYESEETDKEVGSYISDVLSTDIEAYLEGENKESFNAEGYTHVYFRDLSLFGDVSFDEEKREAHLELK